MKHLTTVLVLILASSNASTYFRPEHQLHQESLHAYSHVLPFNIEDSFSTKLLPNDEPSNEWESPDSRIFLLTDLESLDNVMQDEPEDFRMKRMKASLSIDNPLDVLRHQYYKALARRMKFKSIEKNREHLIKTGKRSLTKELEYRTSLGKLSDFPAKGSQKKILRDNDSEESETFSMTGGNEKSSARSTAVRNYKNRLDDFSFQT